MVRVEDRHRRADSGRLRRAASSARRIDLRAARCACDSLSSHRPITLRRKRIVPSTPPSLVKLAARLSSVSTGRSSSTPTSDQVPDEMYAAPGSVIGTPTTAEAVSCDPTAITSRPAAHRSLALTSSRREPIRVPGSTSGGNSERGRPSMSIKVASQLPVPSRAARWWRRWCAPPPAHRSARSPAGRGQQHPCRCHREDSGLVSTASW